MAVAKTVQILACVAVVVLAIYMKEASADEAILVDGKKVGCNSRADCLAIPDVLKNCGVRPDKTSGVCCAALSFSQAGNDTSAQNSGTCTCCTNHCIVAFAHAQTSPSQRAHADALLQTCSEKPICKVDDDKDEKEDDD